MGLGSIFKSVAKIATPFLAGSDLGAVLGAGQLAFGNTNPSTDAYMNQFREGNQFNATQAQLSRDFSASEAQKSRQFSYTQNAANNALATTFAKQGIRWRTADAKAAGIHPLYAQGAASFSPGGVSVGGGSSPTASSVSPNIPGQNYSRARRATLSGFDRHAERLQELQLERAGLENQLLRSEIAKEASAQIGPGFPLTQTQPQYVTSNFPGRPQMEPAAVSSYGWLKTKRGWQKVPSTDAKQKIEDQMIPSIAWAMANTAPDYYGDGEPPPNSFKQNRGTKWAFHKATNTWFELAPRGKPGHVIYNKKRPRGQRRSPKPRWEHLNKWKR